MKKTTEEKREICRSVLKKDFNMPVEQLIKRLMAEADIDESWAMAWIDDEEYGVKAQQKSVKK